MTDVPTEEIEQFSAASREHLQDRAATLAAVLERHTASLLELRGGSSDFAELFALNSEIRAAVAAWDDAVFDHTGSFPVAIQSDDEDSLEDEDDLGDEHAESVSSGDPVAISVVSRWDLTVIDSSALLSAARASHRRLRPSESEEDAEASLENDVGQALYTIVHEHGEPWFEIPGVGAVSGYRAYVRIDSDEPPLEEADLDYSKPPTAPSGEVLYSESW